MSEDNPIPPQWVVPIVPYQPPHVPQPKTGQPITAGLVIAWIAIILAVAGIMRGVWLSARTPAPPTDAGIQLELLGRYSVGNKLIMQSMRGGAPSAEMVAPQLRRLARTPSDQVRIVTVLGELDPQAAKDQLHDYFRESDYATDTREEKNLRLLWRIYDQSPQSLTAGQKTGLEDRYGWFGKLAVSHGAPPGDPLRQSVERIAYRTVTTCIACGLLALLMITAGVVMMILLIIRWSSGRLRLRYQTTTPHIAAILGEGFAIYLVSMYALIDGLPLILHGAHSIAWQGLLLFPPVGAIGCVLVRGVSWGDFCHAVGLNAGRGVLREMGAGIVGYIIGLPSLIVGFGITFILMKWSGQSPLQHPIIRQMQLSIGLRVGILVLACGFAPAVEELMFRGMLLLAHLTPRLRWVASTIVVSLIFAAIHPYGWMVIPALATLAMTLAYIRGMRGTLVASMTAHALHNGLLLTFLLLAGG